jgi:hypothetical protein
MSNTDGRDALGAGETVKCLNRPYSCSMDHYQESASINLKCMWTSSFIVVETFDSEDALERYDAASWNAGDGLYVDMQTDTSLSESQALNQRGNSIYYGFCNQIG